MGGKTSTASKRKWNNANYEYTQLVTQKGEKELIKQAAQNAGQSVNAYILQAIKARMEQEGQRFYGPHYFSAPAYLQYELTRLKLDFVQPCGKVREGGWCPDFTEQEKRDFYEQNRDLFGRYHGDYFTYEEVSQIIEKRLREDAYDKLIRDILCESENRQ